MIRQVPIDGNSKAKQQDSKPDKGKKISLIPSKSKKKPVPEAREVPQVIKENEESSFVPDESTLAASLLNSGGYPNLYNFDGCEEPHWSWLVGGVVDEQMSWGSSWLPAWDVEYMSEAYKETFNDVMWDDDIWNLRGMDQIPNDRRG